MQLLWLGRKFKEGTSPTAPRAGEVGSRKLGAEFHGCTATHWMVMRGKPANLKSPSSTS